MRQRRMPSLSCDRHARSSETRSASKMQRNATELLAIVNPGVLYFQTLSANLVTALLYLTRFFKKRKALDQSMARTAIVR